jgi:UDP-3-O-[3-hydroxymyristoyl] glucosamine N-acyltransferase
MGALSFLANPHYAEQLNSTQASAVIIHPDRLNQCKTAALLSMDPYATYAEASRLFDNRPTGSLGVHATAVLADDVRLGVDVRIGPHVVIEAGTVLGDRVEIGPGSVIGAGCKIDDDSRLAANVTLYHDVKMGKRCLIHSSTVLGSDGFGFAPHKGSWKKIFQLGGVILGDDVEIGASTTIDRGAIEDTRIGHGVIIDNQVHIAHNVEIGDFTAIAGCCGISGSTRIGRHCIIAGAVVFAGHIEICDNVYISGHSTVTNSIREPGSYSSGTALTTATEWRKNVARFRQLDKLARRLIAVEKQLKS